MQLIMSFRVVWYALSWEREEWKEDGEERGKEMRMTRTGRGRRKGRERIRTSLGNKGRRE